MKKGILVLLAVLPAQAQIVNLDKFNSGDFFFTGNTNFSQLLPDVLGGSRTVGFSGDFEIPSTVNVSGGLLTLDRHLGVLTLTYGSYGQAGDAGSLHFNGEGYRLELLTGFNVNPRIEVSFSSSEDGVVSYSAADFIFTVGRDSKPLQLFLGNADLSDIDGFRMTMPIGFDQNFAGNEWILNDARFLSVIPEPSTYAVVFGFGLVGFTAWKRMRRSS